MSSAACTMAVTSDAEPALLSRDDVRQLERLSLSALEAIGAGLVGRREGPGRGTGVEFADYRQYVLGDDVRRIDWNVYARLHELLVTTAPREARLWLSILLDTSRSMDHGQPSKLHYGRRLAALLGTVALLRGDAVQVQVLADGDAVASGRLDAATVLGVLAVEIERLPAGRVTQLARSLRHARAGRDQPEIAVLITDALVPLDDLDGALVELARAADSSVLVHVLDQAESATGPLASVELRDLETGRTMRAEITEQVQRRYAEHYEQFRARVEANCRARGVRYMPAPTAVDPLELLISSGSNGPILRHQAGY
jgi:uncharacterized protein (DUF58 family)